MEGMCCVVKELFTELGLQLRALSVHEFLSLILVRTLNEIKTYKHDLTVPNKKRTRLKISDCSHCPEEVNRLISWHAKVNC